MRPKVARFRACWRAHQHRLDPRRSIFIDETWIKTNMTRTCGWAARGKRLTAHVPHGHCKTLTFLAGLRHDRIVAPFVLDGPINGDAFTAWVGRCLAPTLAPGDIVIADNLGSHKGLPARTLIRNAGAHLLFLPPYSPDLNPIKMVFSKLKTLFAHGRRAQRRSLMAARQNLARRLHPRRMPEPPSTCRICFSVNQTGARGRGQRPRSVRSADRGGQGRTRRGAAPAASGKGPGQRNGLWTCRGGGDCRSLQQRLAAGPGVVGQRPSGLNLFSAVGDVTLAGFAGLQQSGWAQPVTALPDAGPASAMA